MVLVDDQPPQKKIFKFIFREIGQNYPSIIVYILTLKDIIYFIKFSAQ